MIETFVILLTGHLLADFVLQPDALIRMKQQRLGMLVHIAIVGGAAVVTITPRSLWALSPIAVVIVTHLAMDWIKVRYLGDKLWTFVLDQLVHLGVIVALAIWWPAIAAQSLWGLLPAPALAYVYAGFSLICGFIVCVPVGGVVIKKLVEPLAPASTIVPSATLPIATLTPSTPSGSLIKGMKNAGRYIGWLERALTMTFILIKQPEGVGLLLAAKSILRFRDVQDEKDRHQAEYIIIGTFLSFGWALLVALATHAAIARWLSF